MQEEHSSGFQITVFTVDLCYIVLAKFSSVLYGVSNWISKSVNDFRLFCNDLDS